MRECGTCVIGLLPKQISKVIPINNECAQECLKVRVVPDVLIPLLDELWIVLW